MSVISSDIQMAEISPRSLITRPVLQKTKRRWLNGVLWLCLLLACTGASWFSFQYFLVPQTQTYTPDWHNAQWISATNTTTNATAYFRTTLSLGTVPDNAYITVTANQVFYIYVNGFYIGANNVDFVTGDTPETYIFDIGSVLVKGPNAVGIRVVNVDNKTPQVRANLGATWGKTTEYNGTNSSWQATAQPDLAHPRNLLDCNNPATTQGANANQAAYCTYQKMLNGLSTTAAAPGTAAIIPVAIPNIANSYVWTTPSFDTSSWPSALVLPQQPSSPQMHINPLIYEQPLPVHWISSNNAGHEGYFVRSITMPQGFSDAFIRLVATGKAYIYINNHLFIKWDGQVPINENTAAYYEDHEEEAPYRNGLQMGVYNITPYLHAGTNVLAVHVQSPGVSAAQVGLETLKTAMSLDMVVDAHGTTTNPATNDGEWHTATTPVPDWTKANSTAFSWGAPYPVGRPGASHSYYIPDANLPGNVQEMPPMLVVETLLYSTIAILAAWLFYSLVILRKHYVSNQAALETGILAFLPALAVEALLATLAHEPLMPQPFPYTSFWGGALIIIVLLSMLGLWRHARHYNQFDLDEYAMARVKERRARRQQIAEKISEKRTWQEHARLWLRANWGFIPLVLIAIPMVWYNLGYEPYWQDELSSYNAARNIMEHGIPAFPSGFVYPKGELYSYILAAVMFLFGTTSTVVTRSISATWFILSLPLLYVTGTKLFNRKIAWLATAMLTFSPYAMIWARQLRMYEQAQCMVIVVLLAFYYAIKQPDNKRRVTFAIVSLLAAYFSHEENFIILPAILFSVLWWTRQGKYGIPSILKKAYWWKAALVATCIVSIQLLIVFWSHPATFATDQSRRPQVQPSFDNVAYYFGLLFQQQTLKNGVAPWLLTEPLLVVSSLLTVLGCIIAFRQKDWRPRYCAYFLLIATGTLVFIFTMQADRYFYPLLPIYYLLGSYGLWTVMQALWRFARPHLYQRTAAGERNHPVPTRPMKCASIGVATLICASVLLLPMLPISNYDLFVSRVLGLQYRHHYADYDQAGQYVQAHIQKGDIIISVAPAVITLYYDKQVDYYFSIDRALFLFENNEQLLETTSGAHPLLNEEDFENVLATHNRIWLITDNGNYQGGVTKNGRFTFPPSDFRMVFEGYGSAIYFRNTPG